jgi:DNA invertase Pin-like site-specific DNA recombinase
MGLLFSFLTSPPAVLDLNLTSKGSEDERTKNRLQTRVHYRSKHRAATRRRPARQIVRRQGQRKDTNRPELQAALSYCREGDTLIVHSMDRLARSLVDLRGLVTELTGRGIAVEFAKETCGLTETIPLFQFLFCHCLVR